MYLSAHTTLGIRSVWVQELVPLQMLGVGGGIYTSSPSKWHPGQSGSWCPTLGIFTLWHRGLTRECLWL